MVAHAYDPSPGEGDEGRGGQGHPQLHSDSETSLGYETLSQNATKQTNKTELEVFTADEAK